MQIQEESLKAKFTYYFRLIVSLTAVLFASNIEAAQVSGAISRVGEATHIEFKGRSDWQYDLRRVNSKTLTLVVPAFDQATETVLSAWADSLVENVKIQKSGPDGKYEITFTLAGKDVESFDYLTDDPSRLILDFYKQTPQPEPTPVVNNGEVPSTPQTKTPGPAKTAGKKARSTGKLRGSTGYKKRQRKPAGELLKGPNKKSLSFVDDSPMRGVFDGGDPAYNRFKVRDYEINEDSIIASRQNIYIRFPILEMRSPRFKELIESSPEYVINSKETKENKEARLLKVLYGKGRYATFLKTYKYFIETYPESIYDEIVRNMAAEVHFKLWKRDDSKFHLKKFRDTYRFLANKYPGSVLADRTDLILAYSHYELGESTEALRTFMEYLRNNPKSPERDRVRLVMADAFMKINKPKDAIREYKKLEKDADDKVRSIEATFRIGDVYMDQRQYKKAVKAYKRALRKYPKYVGVFPNAQYNLSEAQFWLGKYKQGINNFVEFLRLYPSHSHGGYAMTRIGELLEILGVDRSRVIGAFVESYFRFRSSPGAEVARIRMLSQRLKGMREKEVTKALEEMYAISKKSKLPRISEFTTLMIADGMHRRQEFDRALGTLVSYYQKNPTSSNLSFFRKRILRNISDVIHEDIKKKNFMESLKTYGKYSTNWLRNNERVDIPYFIARSYEQAGVLTESVKGYQKILKKLKKIKGTDEHKERRVTEHLPTIDQVNLRLAAVALEQRRYRDAYKYIRAVKNDLQEPEAVEKVSVAAKIALKRGDANGAKKLLRKLVNSWEGRPDLVAQTHVQLASLEMESRNFNEAEDLIASTERIINETETVPEDVVAKALEVKGDIQLKRGREVSAVENYLDLLERFEEKRPMSNIRFKVGKILFERGDIKGAEKIWARLDNQQGQFYFGLAQEKLKNAKWQDEYKKYINRIPAAAEIR